MRKYLKMGFIALMLITISANSKAEENLQIRGSDTMVNLIQRMAEVYMEKYPEKKVAVTGGGSGTGIAGLRNRTVDIANSSREMKGRELVDSKAKGVDPVLIVVGVDCITIVVNESNKVDKLTNAQLGAIFRGDIVNWKEVGGDDMPITLYGRQSNSGTFVQFREDVLKSDYSDEMRRMNGNSQIIESVKNDKSGIGYVGLGHAKHSTGSKVLKIATMEGEEYIDPTVLKTDEVKKYSIIRTLIQYTNGKPEGSTKDFIEFELSPEGQKVCEEMGFLPLNEEYAKQNEGIF
ncbi:MAG: phosphate ABC transporter substrate-binding protein [Candidatus Omnitrophica bacterium]|nr:phosphate ABC transporter substrate-binding protein [Candidatus Omnitrophota bacterium]